MRKATLVALLLFAALSLVLTYPLALHLGTAVEDRQDALLNVWITAWDGHQLLSDPLHLFDANIFHPYPRTLAYSELLLGNGLLALPITAATGNPVLGYNVAILLSFFLSALGTYLLVLQLTRSPAAGLVAGIIFAYSSFRMTNLAQAQLLTTQWLPFALLSLHQLMRRPRPRHIAIFVLFFCLQALSSFYYAILLALAVVGFALWTFVLHPASRSRRTLLALLLAACCCALIILPFALPYFQVQRDLGFERTLADNEPFSASLRQYLMVPPGSALHEWWLPSDNTPIAGGYPVDALFPGLITVALALWGLIRGRGWTRWFFLLLLVVSWTLSLGPRLYLAPGDPSSLDATLPYAWLFAIVPGFKALRAPVRFDVLISLALAVLAGYGVAALGRIGRPARLDSDTGEASRPTWHWLSRVGIPALLVAVVVLESLIWPAAHIESVAAGDSVPSVYRWLAEQEAGPVLELPMVLTPGGPQLEYQYFSTYHWQTTPDGYSGFVPPKQGQIVYEMERFPSERSVSLLQALGVEHLVIHTDRYPAARWLEMQTALAQADALTLVEVFDADHVYQVQPWLFDTGDLAVSAYLPPRAAAGQPYTAYVIAVNHGDRSYALQPTDLIEPAATWQTTRGNQEDRVSGDVPLVTSHGGGAAVIPLPLTAPDTPGTAQLVLGETDGPLGTWTSAGAVVVGDQGDDAFPVPVRLENWTMAPTARAGEPYDVGLVWRALGKIDAYYSTYVKMMDPEGNAIAGWDGQPRDGAAPTLLWVPGEAIEDAVTLVVPAGTPPGEYVVEAGMYRAADLARCLTLAPDGTPVARVVLGTVRIEP